MINKLIVLLRSPYPMLYKRWKSVVFPSVIIFLILFFLEPFGLSRVGSQKFWVVLGYGGVSALVLSIFVYILPSLFRQYYKNWTFGKNFLQMALLWITIAIGNFLYSVLLFHSALSWEVFNSFLFWVVLLAPIPTVFFIMWNRNLLLARNLKEAMEINLYLAKNSEKKEWRESVMDSANMQGLKMRENELPDSGIVIVKGNIEKLTTEASEMGTDPEKWVGINAVNGAADRDRGGDGVNNEELIDENRSKESRDKDRAALGEVIVLSFSRFTKEKLDIQADEFLYMEADGNYVRVVYRKGEREFRKLLRATMKQAEGVMRDCPYILRCHRAFLVNIRKIVKVNGNSQGYRLSLRDCEDEIPVSRTYTSDVKYLIEHLEEG